MKEVAPEERPKVGQLVNETRAKIEELLEDSRLKLEEALREEKMKAEVIDVTLPAKKVQNRPSASEYDCPGRGRAYLYRYGL